jgi:hypothetical protein
VRNALPIVCSRVVRWLNGALWAVGSAAAAFWDKWSASGLLGHQIDAAVATAASSGGGLLSLRQYLEIALVPSTVPAGVLLIALVLGLAVSDSWDEKQSEVWEQVAGGALLLTYFKELFPRVMELGEVVVNSRETVGARALILWKMTTTAMMVASIFFSALMLGLVNDHDDGTCDCHVDGATLCTGACVGQCQLPACREREGQPPASWGVCSQAANVAACSSLGDDLCGWDTSGMASVSCLAHCLARCSATGCREIPGQPTAYGGLCEESLNNRTQCMLYHEFCEWISGGERHVLHTNTTGGLHDHHDFTPGMTVAFFFAFFIDGVVLAYDDNPVAMDSKLVKQLILSAVFSIDNLLDGLGLVPVLQDAFGDGWWFIMVLFSGCVLLGAVCTACLRRFLPHPLVHLLWFCLGTTTILYGAMELLTKGLEWPAVVGMCLVWLVLFCGDVVDDIVDAAGSVQMDKVPPWTSLSSSRQQVFAETTRSAGLVSSINDMTHSGGGAGGGTARVPPPSGPAPEPEPRWPC